MGHGFLFLFFVSCVVASESPPDESQVRGFGEKWRDCLEHKCEKLQGYYTPNAVIVNSKGASVLGKLPSLSQALVDFKDATGTLLKVIPTKGASHALYKTTSSKTGQSFYSYARIENTEDGPKIATQIFPVGSEAGKKLGNTHSERQLRKKRRRKKKKGMKWTAQWDEAYRQKDWTKMKTSIYTPDAVLVNGTTAKMITIASMPASQLATFFPNEKHSRSKLLKEIRQGPSIMHLVYQVSYKDGNKYKWKGYSRLEKNEKNEKWQIAADIWPLAVGSAGALNKPTSGADRAKHL